MYLVQGVLAAVIDRATTGLGRKVDVAMLDGQLAILEHAIALTTVTGTPPVPTGARHPSITPFETFHAADGLFVIAAGNDSLFAKLCGVLGLPLADDPRFASNPPERCYFCKGHLFQDLAAIAQEAGLRAVIYGATLDDLGDHRPGMRAAKEAGARAPLLEAQLTKEDVRTLSRQLDLPTWDKPAQACLASRFPYHATITAAALGRVEQAENLLRREFGLRQVRVRHHDTMARLEIELTDLPLLLDEETRRRVVAGLKALDYTYVTVDLEGFRSGSMNEVLA